MSDRHVHPHGELHNPDTAHEHTDISINAIVMFVVVLTVTALVIHLAMWGVFKVLAKIEEKEDPSVSPYASAPARSGSDFPSPSLQTTPWVDLQHLRADENAYLHSYAWVDETAGVARIPIDKAKALLLKKGLPVRPELADAMEGTRTAATGESSGGRNLAAGGADRSSPVPAAAPAAVSPKPPEAAKADAVTPKKPGGGL
jgi:hypothetical protein